MRLYENHFSWRHLMVALTIYLLLAITLFLLMVGDRYSIPYRLGIAFAVVLGPMAGGTIRGFQGCCFQFGLSILPWFGGVTLAGLVLQFVRLPDWRASFFLRWGGWVIGVLSWFLGAFISYLHAFS